MLVVGLTGDERPSTAFSRLLRARAAAWMLPHGACRGDSLNDQQVALLEQRIVQGPIVDARDLMAIAQELAFQHSNDPSMTDPALIQALIGGLTQLFGVRPIQLAA